MAVWLVGVAVCWVSVALQLGRTNDCFSPFNHLHSNFRFSEYWLSTRKFHGQFELLCLYA